ncbi:MAG: hypothetical protein ACRC0L_12760 [Angustibacter sp.]
MTSPAPGGTCSGLTQEPHPMADFAALRARCRALAYSLDFDSGHDIGSAIRAVEGLAGARIIASPLPRNVPPEITGLCLRQAQEFYLWYADHDPWHSMISIAHELGHILGGHISGAGGRELPLDHLDRARAAWGPLYRCHLGTRDEAEAELIGSFIVERLESRPLTQQAQGLSLLFAAKSARQKKHARG